MLTKARLIAAGLTVGFVMGGVSMSRAQELEPPKAAIHPQVDTVLGRERVDNYFWLRGKEKPEVIEYLEAENEYTEAMMRHAKPLREKVYQEMISRIVEDDSSVPVKRGNYYYYHREEKGKQYKIYCRKTATMKAVEEVLLDLNQLAAGKEFMSLGTYEISPDHTMLLYGTDEIGSERYDLRVKNLTTGELYPEVIETTSGNAVWANDNKTIFYTIPDDAWRPFKLYRHTLGTDKSEDILVHHEEDDMFWMGITRSKSGEYLLLEMGSITTSEVRFLKASNPGGSFRTIHPRQHEMEYYVYHRGDEFYVRTNEDAKNFKIMKTAVSAPEIENWTEVVAHRDKVKIDAVDLFSKYMVLYERENGLKTISVTDLNTNDRRYVGFPEPVYTYFGSENPEFEGETFRFTYESLVSPEAVYDYNMSSHRRELRKEKQIPGGYDKSMFTSERTFAKADDGTAIPISVVYKKGVPLDGSSPLLLNGYGAYGSSREPYFSTVRLSLLDRGVIYAIAHVRGGGEMGRYWYDQGKLLNKRNTFTDFINCGEHLVAEQYTNSNRMGCTGGSAGGLLIGAVVNMRPDLFLAAVTAVPFVDLMNTMLDETIPLTAIEWEEWGNPNEEKYYDYMMSYSPYDNVTSQDYPHMLVLTGLNDTRVPYWESAKWTARLRDSKTDDNLLLLKIQMGSGHGGASGRYERLKDYALEYAFLLDRFGISE